MHTFKRVATLQIIVIGFWLIAVGWWIKKDSIYDLFPKNIPHDYIDLMAHVQLINYFNEINYW